MSLEAAFAIGRPAPSAAYRTCSRCNGTGWWSFGRKCFKCGGSGHAERVTTATKIRDKAAHIAEVEGIVAQCRTLLETARFGRKSRQVELDKRTAQLEILRAELAALQETP